MADARLIQLLVALDEVVELRLDALNEDVEVVERHVTVHQPLRRHRKCKHVVVVMGFTTRIVDGPPGEDELDIEGPVRGEQLLDVLPRRGAELEGRSAVLRVGGPLIEEPLGLDDAGVVAAGLVHPLCRHRHCYEWGYPFPIVTR